MNIEFNRIEDTWLQILCAMLIECEWMIKGTKVLDTYTNILFHFEQERKNRKLNESSIYNSIPFPSHFFGGRREPLDLPSFPEGLVSDQLTDEEVLVLYALGAEISDFSCLGNGIRRYVQSVWINFQTELKKRKIEPEFFCDFSE